MRDYITIRQRAFYDFLNNYNKDKSKKEAIKLDLKDLVIFEYIAQFCLSENERIKNNRIVVEDKEYTHIAYKKIIEDNPFLDISSKRHILRVVNKLEKLGLINKHFSKEKGNKTYFNLGHTGHTLATSMSQPLGHTSHNPSDTDVVSLRTSMSDNSNINIDNKNSNIKIESKNSFFNLYIGEKTFLSVIFNLKDLGLKYGLRAYKEKEYLKAYKKLLKKGYYDSQLISAIYARMYKATMDEVDKFKFLQTIVNPKYLVKSIDQLINEKDILIDNLMDTYEENIEVIDDEKILYQVLFITYYEDYKEVRELISDNGYFEDITGNQYHLKDLEYYLYLMTKFLSRYDIELLPSIRNIIISVVTNQLTFDEFMKRLLFGVIYLEDNNQLEELQAYSDSKELANLYKDVLSNLQIDKNLDEVMEELEKRIIVE